MGHVTGGQTQTYHGEETAGHPDQEGEVDTAGGLKNSCGRHEDAAADDAANYDGAAVQEGQLRLHLHTLRLLLRPDRLVQDVLTVLTVLHHLVLAADQSVAARTAFVRPLHHPLAFNKLNVNNLILNQHILIHLCE